ncbi:hypothetical protein [Nitratireductor sp. ZSWI3]|uniref:hypothetical protein n=1 Tax=Nitratireductor sp. ZSWI3 TaxID=2966359 RepID=UPI0021503E65|nr:hypothetical protein [Nitratireductor sp. ZSWI3]MCR4266835.1 hypothetical protein [Nitratireductor sp. ZSWI3]
MPSRPDTVRVLLDLNGRTYSSELGIDVERNTPSPLYRWLVACTLFSARISQALALSAAKALSQHKWNTPQKMAASTWAQRTKVLNQSGYARYDESTSRMLGDAAGHLLDAYGGDLRRLREAAGRDPRRERALLKEFKGIGDVGADIFFREVQTVWDELYPFVDKKALAAAKRLGLPASGRELAKLVPRRDLPRLLSALVRTDLAKDGYEAVKERAGQEKAG